MSAKDKATGKEQSIRIEASSGLSEEEIKRMKQEAEANAAADAKEKERIDTLNKADAVIFQTEKQLQELGDKIPADKKATIEEALGRLKEAHKNQNVEAIEPAIKDIENAFGAAQQDILNAQQQAANPGAGAGQSAPSNDNQGGDHIDDVEFEEVK